MTNTLLSETFAESSSMTGDLARQNAASASKGRGLGVSIRAAFITSQMNETHDKFMPQDSQCLAGTGFDPQHLEQHSWEGLQSAREEVNGQCREASCWFTQSGTRESEFFHFCNDQKDVCHLC